MVFRRRKENKHGLMALVGETAKMAKHMVVLDKTEAALEKELERERTHKPTTKVGKLRKKGSHLLHTKQILLMVVILNIIDCMLVLGELMLDIKYVTGLLTTEYELSDKFIGTMKGLHPDRLDYIVYDDIMTLRHELEIAHITWDRHGGSHGQAKSQSKMHDGASSNITHTTLASPTTTFNASSGHVRTRRASGSTSPHGNSSHTGHDHQHSLEEDIAHGLHKASIAILGILVIETLMKIFFLGKELLEHKLECFDGFIVCVSFIVDLVFLKGLQQFKVQEFVLILAFMVPWRVIRVVNSLVVAIMDHGHFRLKLLYKQKKKTVHELKEAQSEISGLNACIKELGRLCSDAGVSETYVQAKLTMFRKVKSKSNPMAALSGFAIGGEAMKTPFPKPMPNGDTTHVTDVVVSVQPEKPDKSKENGVHVDNASPVSSLKRERSISSVSSDKKEHPLRKAFNRITLDESRPRSRSATDFRHTPSESTENSIVDLLAETSASFIATISNEDVNQSEVMTQNQTDDIRPETTKADSERSDEQMKKEDRPEIIVIDVDKTADSNKISQL